MRLRFSWYPCRSATARSFAACPKTSAPASAAVAKAVDTRRARLYTGAMSDYAGAPPIPPVPSDTVTFYDKYRATIAEYSHAMAASACDPRALEDAHIAWRRLMWAMTEERVKP